MNDLLVVIVAIFVIFIFAKFMKPIVKACVSMLALIVIISITVAFIYLYKTFGIESFLIISILVLSLIGEIIALVLTIIKKIFGLRG